MSTSKYWPLDMDSEGQIYDNVAWDLPGFRRPRQRPNRSRLSKKAGDEKPQGR
jgi:hypothetical protein